MFLIIQHIFNHSIISKTFKMKKYSCERFKKINMCYFYIEKYFLSIKYNFKLENIGKYLFRKLKLFEKVLLNSAWLIYRVCKSHL